MFFSAQYNVKRDAAQEKHKTAQENFAVKEMELNGLIDERKNAEEQHEAKKLWVSSHGIKNSIFSSGLVENVKEKMLFSKVYSGIGERGQCGREGVRGSGNKAE